MFLEALRRRNPDFLRAAARLHADGVIPANSYVLDTDAIQANAEAISLEAARYSLTVYAMTKQVSRNPHACAAMRSGGIDAAVAVDMTCARAVVDAGMRLGHLGHLVQVPASEAAEAAAMAPDYWTVFSREKAAQTSAACAAIGRQQDVLLRIQAPGDTFYTGHEGGFAADDVLAVADYVDTLPGARFAGVTTFPALLFSESTGEVTPTHNLATLQRATARLRAAGRDPQVNTP